MDFLVNFARYLWMTASIPQQLLALYFIVIYIRQLSSSERSLVGKKNSSIYFKDFTDLDFFYTIFVRLLWEMPVYLFGYAKRILYCTQPTILLAWRYLKTMLLTNFENLNSISNTSQETRNFLVLKDPVINIYLRATRHFCDQGTALHHTSKLLKGDLVQT